MHRSKHWANGLKIPQVWLDTMSTKTNRTLSTKTRNETLRPADKVCAGCSWLVTANWWSQGRSDGGVLVYNTMMSHRRTNLHWHRCSNVVWLFYNGYRWNQQVRFESLPIVWVLHLHESSMPRLTTCRQKCGNWVQSRVERWYKQRFWYL